MKLGRCRLAGLAGEVFAGIHKEILFETVLFVVELFITAAEVYQVIVASSLQHRTCFDHEDLIGTSNS